MRFLIDPARPLATSIRSLCAMTIFLGLMGGNCQPPPSDGDSPGGQVEPPLPGGAPVVSIISPTLSRNIPAGSTITITYSVANSATDVVAFIDVDADPTNDNEIVFATGLLDGTNRTVNFVSAGIVPDVYNIGIRAINSSGTTIAFARSATGEMVTITVNGLPQPVINSPSSDLEVLFGTASTIAVVFSCNDAENFVSWQVFFDTDQIIDGTEITIENGTGNTDPGSFNTTVNWPTLTVPEGDYSIGLICTDSAQSQAVAYAAGKVKISSELTIPTVEVTAPAENRVAFPDEQIVINFSASSTSTVGATITLFLDLDNDGFDGSEPRIASELPLSATTTTVNSSIIPDGIYFIGGFVEQGIRRSAVDYAPGKLTVVGVGDLVVTKPADPLTVTPGTNVSIGWNTNVPNGQGLIDLTLFTSDALGTPGLPVVPDPLADEKDQEINPSTATLDTSSLPSGFYVVRVELTPVDENDVPTGEEIEPAFSQPIRITTLPTVLWVGSIELEGDQISNPPLGHFDGVIFEGLQFEDNAGTDLLAVGDIDGQAGDDFVIGARFAKPLFSNPNGIGIGEAYLIYSDSRINRSNRRFSLNAVGLDTGESNPDPNSLPGLVFFGIRFDPDSEDIDGDGILDGRAANGLPIGGGCYTEDADGDGKLDQFDEDVNNNGLLDAHEDRDLDLHLDIVEDGVLWRDPNCVGIAAGGTSFTVPQFVNGFLDTLISEDRDNDGKLDIKGDDTQGLTSLGLMPDMDLDGLPEIVLGFKDTDSVKPGRPGDHNEPNNFGTHVQPNQFERGGIVIVPTLHNLMVGDRSFPGRFNDDRILELDRSGQEFFDVEQNVPNVGDCCGTHDEGGCTNFTIAGCVCDQLFQCCIDAIDGDPFFNGWDIVCVLAVEQLGCAVCDEPPEDVNSGPGIVGNVLPGRPTDGMDAYPLTADAATTTQPAGNCGGQQVSLVLVNNLWTPLIANPDLTITVFDPVGDPTVMQNNGLLLVPGTTTTLCIDCDPQGAVMVELGIVGLLDPGSLVQLDFIEPPEDDGDDPASGTVACGDAIVFAFLGPDDPAAVDPNFDSLLVCAGTDADPDDPEFCNPDNLGPPEGCDLVTEIILDQTLDCDDTIIGPYFGFSYFGLTGVPGSQTQFESPSHPLAYDQTLSNPAVRRQEFEVMAQLGPCNNCGHVLIDADPVRNIDFAPPFDRISSGFYPGATDVGGPVGARILGQAVGDQFGQSISMSPGTDDRVFVSSPNRTVDGMSGAGAVYQWEMKRYWHIPLPDLSNGLSAVDSFGGTPKPHQYIIKDVGFDTPDNSVGAVEGSIKFAITYTGAGAGDGLGAAILGITDFNGDAQEDLVMGAPHADGANDLSPDSGAVYIIYRRPPTIEGQAIDLNDIALSRSDPNRLNGMLINGDPGSEMGQVLSGNCDMNGDGTNDVVIGIPDGQNGRGEVVIVFGSPNPNADYLPSPVEGYPIQELVTKGVAVRIQGAFDGDQAGFNVACDGDFDGDGQNDLLIAAPFATPRFDSDGDDILDTEGLDLDRDGQPDVDSSGQPLIAQPDGAGLVYIITNGEDLSGTLSLSQMGGALQGFIIAGIGEVDPAGGTLHGQLGGGVENKRGTRSKGLAYAGDVDGDGRSDVLISSIFADPNGKTNAGEVYLIYGFTAQQAAGFVSGD